MSTLIKRMLECLEMMNLMTMEMRPPTSYMPSFKEMCQETPSKEQQQITTQTLNSPPL